MRVNSYGRDSFSADTRMSRLQTEFRVRRAHIQWRGRLNKLLLAGAACILACHVATPLSAEPVLDRALSAVQLLKKGSCSIVKVEFNFRVRYISHFPIGRGDELRVAVRPVDPTQANALALLSREALRPPIDATAAIKAIDFEVDQPTGPVLRVQFEHPVSYQVAQGGDFESIVVAISGKTPSAACKPEFPSTIGGSWNTTISPWNGVEDATVVVQPRNRPVGELTAAELNAVGASMDEARAALKKSNLTEAKRLLASVLRRPENEHSAEAQELLGVAYQKSGQVAQARAEYEDYIRRYPNAEGTDRVRQRLAGIVTAAGEPSDKLRPPKMEAGTGVTTWNVSGSASQFYIRDDSFRVLRDPSLPPTPNPDKDDHRVHRNALLSSFDLIAAWQNDQFKSKLRFSGTEEHAFDSDKGEIFSVAALFFETTMKQWGVMTRIGRQTRSTGGVLGRFDGGLVSWQASPFVRLNAVAGSPVERRSDEPFKDDRYFYGASMDLGPFWGGFEASLFAIEQRDRSFLDRQAIGAELRYIDATKSGFATIDYDVHFQELNAAIFNGSWTLPDKSTLSAAFDYRKSPYLSSWTAIQGQPFLTLYDMLRVHTEDEIHQWAIDRTPTYKAATVGYSRPITNKLQASADVTVSNISGTAASGGVDAMPSVGDELYYSAQLIGTSLLTDGDMYIVGLRAADRQASNLYVLDLNSRYPLTSEFRINPRLRLGYEVGDHSDLREYTVLPSILLNYYWSRDLSFELEVGGKWTSREEAGVKETTTDLFFTAGFRYDFYADDRSKCPFSFGLCK
jgi:tetratricopeptide (TPR) repeat protein